MASGNNQDDKKSITNGFGFFVLAAIFAVMFVQNFFEAKSAKVFFSYQIEHLVNLGLIRSDASAKTATSSQLVNFSGQFQDQLNDSSRQRFHYLELIHEQNQSKKQFSDQEAITKAASLKALESLKLYRQFASTHDLNPVAALSKSEDLLGFSNPVLASKEVKSIQQMRREWESAKDSPELTKKYLKDITVWLNDLLSPNLGLSIESYKDQFRLCLKKIQAVASVEDFQEIAKVVDETLNESNKILLSVSEAFDQGHLTQLRALREFKNNQERLQNANERIVQVKALLDKQRQNVKDVIWFFNNKELSSSSLEQQDVEEYSHWFERAKAEWDRFAFNSKATFKANDQPNYLVLERTFRSEEAPLNYFGLFLSLLPVILIGMLLYYMFAKQMKGVGSSAMSFGKSPAKLLQKGTHKITFKDVAGIDEAKEELQEIVEFLKDPKKFTHLGAEIPKGVLCVGPPGTGKTLVAKAVAGEADRPFFSISGSDFVEMFVGVGASRIRDMFKEAKKQAPCIIFMDEIDAVGRHRGVGMGGGHDEREQTLNQLLVEMDGFDANEGIILMAATNRPDVLDKALLRPGRFDRRVTIDLPDVKGRFEILKLHAQKIKMNEQVDLMKVARATPGSSGADLKNILNEAALRAVRVGNNIVQAEDVDYATDKVRFGKERRSLEMTTEEINRTAYHEAGHAIIGVVSKYCDPVEKVTVIPRGLSLGATYTLPKGNRVGYWKEELLDILAMVMGGRAAEEIFIGDISSGAQSDIQRVTQLVRSMVCEWGMSDLLGQIAYEERSDANMYLGGGQASPKNYSENTSQIIDNEVRILVKQAHEKALKILSEHKEQGLLMAQMLMEFETLDAQDIQDIMKLQFDKQMKEKKMLQGIASLAKVEEKSSEESKNQEEIKEENKIEKDLQSRDNNSHKDES